MSWQCQCGAHNDKAALACEGCGHEPNTVPAGADKRPTFGMYREVTERPPEPEITPSQHEAIKAMLERLRATFATTESAGPRPKAADTKRCPACETGNFIHGGVRYCLADYQRL